MAEQITFRSDTRHRKEWLTGVHFAHPAKLNLSLQLYLYERYTKPGDVVLDPMAGSGTALLGCALGRHVVCVELEPKFLDMMRGNWEKIRQRGPQMGYEMGEAVILQGDARKLEGLLAEHRQEISCILTSPPYASTEYKEDFEFYRKRMLREIPTRTGARGTPTEEAMRRNTSGLKSENPDNIGNLVYGDISAIVTSPPYEKSLDRWAGDKQNPLMAEKRLHAMPKPEVEAGYSSSGENIGNLESADYLSAMAQVYQQGRKVLKPDGLLILVVKPFIRDKAIVPLQEHTRALCERVGFAYVEELHRKLLAQSFWRILYRQKFPGVPLLDTEYVMVFRKEG